MAWTTPRTWVTSEVVTAALLNTHVKDNLKVLEGGGDLGLLGSVGSVPVWRIPDADVQQEVGTFTNTSYLPLASVTGGTAWTTEVEVTVATGAQAMVWFGGNLYNNTADAECWLAYAVSGATTVAANDAIACIHRVAFASRAITTTSFWLPTLTPGNNTFTLHARVSAGLGVISLPKIMVMPL